jgi:hypothetical protein
MYENIAFVTLFFFLMRLLKVQTSSKHNVAFKKLNRLRELVLQIRVPNVLRSLNHLSQELLQTSHASDNAACNIKEYHDTVMNNDTLTILVQGLVIRIIDEKLLLTSAKCSYIKLSLSKEPFVFVRDRQLTQCSLSNYSHHKEPP